MSITTTPTSQQIQDIYEEVQSSLQIFQKDTGCRDQFMRELLEQISHWYDGIDAGGAA